MHVTELYNFYDGANFVCSKSKVGALSRYGVARRPFLYSDCPLATQVLMLHITSFNIK